MSVCVPALGDDTAECFVSMPGAVLDVGLLTPEGGAGHGSGERRAGVLGAGCWLLLSWRAR